MCVARHSLHDRTEPPGSMGGGEKLIVGIQSWRTGVYLTQPEVPRGALVVLAGGQTADNKESGPHRQSWVGLFSAQQPEQVRKDVGKRTKNKKKKKEENKVLCKSVRAAKRIRGEEKGKGPKVSRRPGVGCPAQSVHSQPGPPACFCAAGWQR